MRIENKNEDFVFGDKARRALYSFSVRRIATSVALSILVALSAHLQSFAAPTIAGTKCNKVGATKLTVNLKFTCIKSGSKLIWNKGVVRKPTPSATPTPSPSPTPSVSQSPSPTASPSSTPSPIPTTRREKALAEVRKVYERNAGKNPAASVKYIISSDAPTRFVQMTKEVIPVSARFWADVFDPGENFPVIIGNFNSVTWVQEEMKKYGHNLTDWDVNKIRSEGLSANRGDVRANERSTITQYVIGEKSSENIPNNLEMMRAFVSHEYVHAVAVSILGDRHEGIPGWSDEGSANFFAFAITSLMSEDPNSAMRIVNRNNLRRPYFDQGLVPHSLTKDALHEAIVLSEKGGGGEGTTCAEPKILCYSAGALMTEILVADYGVEKFVQWWRASRVKNWEVAFEEIYNYQIDQWYEDVAIPYILEESRIAVPEVKSASTITATRKFPARPSRPFIEPGYKSQEAIGALKAWEAQISGATKDPVITFYAGATTDTELVSVAKKFADATIRYFSKYKEALQPTTFYITNEKDLDWFIAELGRNELGLSESDKSNIRNNMSQWGDYSATRSSNGKTRIELGISTSRGVTFNGTYRANNIGALTTRAIQSAIAGGNQRALPCWTTTGTLDFFGLVTNRQVEAPDYFVERINQVGAWYEKRSQYNFKNFNTADWQSFLPKVNTTPNLGCENDSFVKPVGFMFTELLMSQYGMDKIVNWWSLIKTNSDWRANFNQAFGVDYESWQKQSAIPYLMTQMQKFLPPIWMK